MKLIVFPHDDFVSDFALRNFSRTFRIADAILGAVPGSQDPLSVDHRARANFVDAWTAYFDVGSPDEVFFEIAKFKTILQCSLLLNFSRGVWVKS